MTESPKRIDRYATFFQFNIPDTGQANAYRLTFRWPASGREIFNA